MNNVKILKVLRKRNYTLLALFSSITVLLIYPAIQVYTTGGLQNYNVWFEAIPIFNLTVFILFGILFGPLLALQIYNRKNATCSLEKRRIGASSGGVGALIAFFVPACPACLSIATFILPTASALSFTQFISKYGVYLLIVSVGLMILGIYLQDGFKQA